MVSGLVVRAEVGWILGHGFKSRQTLKGGGPLIGRVQKKAGRQRKAFRTAINLRDKGRRGKTASAPLFLDPTWPASYLGARMNPVLPTGSQVAAGSHGPIFERLSVFFKPFLVPKVGGGVEQSVWGQH